MVVETKTGAPLDLFKKKRRGAPRAPPEVVGGGGGGGRTTHGAPGFVSSTRLATTTSFPGGRHGLRERGGGRTTHAD